MDQHQGHLVSLTPGAFLDLEFIGIVKLVNYLRCNSLPDALKENDSITEFVEFQDDKYLKPTLQDDALLYNLDEILEKKTSSGDNKSAEISRSDTVGQVRELQEQLDRLKADFAGYKAQVDRSFHDSLSEVEARLPTTQSPKNASEISSSKRRTHPAEPPVLKQYEDDYFNSYSYNSR